jgi:hypothetical protein
MIASDAAMLLYIHMQSIKYVTDVLLPEALIRLTMDFYGLTYDEVGKTSSVDGVNIIFIIG